jgi:ribosomal protein S18 acetylase RimI-like enzyme
MSQTNVYSIRQIEAQGFDRFLVYLNDHLSDNGKDGVAYFQPLSQNEPRFPSERSAAFRSGLTVPVGQTGWRRLWVAVSAAERIIGHIDLRGHAERFAEHRCLLGMGVDRAHRKVGLGNALIRQAEEWVKANELLEWIDLQVLSNNTKAIRLYERSGFKQTGETPDMFRIDGKSFSYTAMTKHVHEGER